MRIEHDFQVGPSKVVPQPYGKEVISQGIRTYQNIGSMPGSISESGNSHSVGIGNVGASTKGGLTISPFHNVSVTFGGIANKYGNPIISIKTTTPSTYHSTSWEYNSRQMGQTVQHVAGGVVSILTTVGSWGEQAAQQVEQNPEEVAPALLLFA